MFNAGYRIFNLPCRFIERAPERVTLIARLRGPNLLLITQVAHAMAEIILLRLPERDVIRAAREACETELGDIVLPVANGTDLVAARFVEDDVAAARTGIARHFVSG